MTLALNVDSAMRGRCIICYRRLPKAKIPLYLASHWQVGMTDTVSVEVCVCNDRCLKRYEDGEVAP